MENLSIYEVWGVSPYWSQLYYYGTWDDCMVYCLNAINNGEDVSRWRVYEANAPLSGMDVLDLFEDGYMGKG